MISIDKIKVLESKSIIFATYVTILMGFMGFIVIPTWGSICPSQIWVSCY